MAPSFEKCPGLSILKHAWSAHDDHGIVFFVLNFFLASEIMNMLILEGISSFLVESFFDLLTEHIDVCFIYFFALIDEFDGVIYSNVF